MLSNFFIFIGIIATALLWLQPIGRFHGDEPCARWQRASFFQPEHLSHQNNAQEICEIGAIAWHSKTPGAISPSNRGYYSHVYITAMEILPLVVANSVYLRLARVFGLMPAEKWYCEPASSKHFIGPCDINFIEFAMTHRAHGLPLSAKALH